MKKIKQSNNKRLVTLISLASLLVLSSIFSTFLASADGFASLPADPTPSSDVLMRETFTDGNIKTGTESITNPIWKTNSVAPNLLTTETNAYMYSNYENSYYVAGDSQWTDYSTSVDLTFTTDTLPNALNRVSLLVRHKDIAQYGYEDYVVTLKSGNTISIGRREFKSGILAEETVFTSSSLNYLSNLGTANTLKVNTFDNVISVYWNSALVLSYTDTGEFGSSIYDIKTTGNIGFYTSQAYVQFDNITVSKLVDDNGGDYDNEMGGNFEAAIPDYIDTYIANGWLY